MFKFPKIDIHTTRFQQGIIFFSVFYIATMLFIQYEQSYIPEKNIVLTKIEKQAERLTSVVEVGLYVNNFPRLSFLKNSFVIDAIVWFKFPIGTESLDTIEKFTFQNGEILSKSTPMVLIQDEDVSVRYHVVVKLSTNLNRQYFPISDHKLTILLQNITVSPYELYFKNTKEDLLLSDDLLSGNWRAFNTDADYGYIQAIAKSRVASLQAPFPCASFIIDFKNEDLRFFIILYLPLFILFFLIFSSLLISVERLAIRLPVVAGVIPILALQSLVIASISPAGSRVTKIDQIYLTLVVLSLIILLFQSYIGLVFRGVRHESSRVFETKRLQLKKMNDIVIIIVLAILLLSLTYSTFV